MLVVMPRKSAQITTPIKAACAGLALAVVAPAVAPAQVMVSDLDEVVRVSLLPGWRVEPSRHIAAISIDLAPGWKTYWRSPGEGGLPTEFDWTASENLESARVSWPRPEVFRDYGMRSIGYVDQVVLPVTLTPQAHGDISLSLHMRFGVCKEICIPADVVIDHILSDETASPDPRIEQSLEQRPLRGPASGLTDIECELAPMDGAYQLSVRFTAPDLPGRSEALVIEAGSPEIWTSEPDVSRSGDTIRATATMHMGTETNHADPSRFRFTMISTTSSVEQIGCNPG